MHYDAIIVGGGLSGGALAALLGTMGFHVACIDRGDPVAQAQEKFDGRTTAISWGSQKILAAAGIWDFLAPEACAIRAIDILDGDSPVLLRFDSSEVQGRSFGWIVENRLLRTALFQRMALLDSVAHHAPEAITGFNLRNNAAHVTLKNGKTLSAPLLVGADGRNSAVREWAGIGTRDWSYHQQAIVCTVEHEHSHNHVAVEHFRAQGPFAALPMTDGPDGAHRSSVVWTEHGTGRNTGLRAPQPVFDAALTARFPACYGRVRQTGGRFSYPLGLQHAHTYTAPRTALVADAAHGIHPIAGQGLNLGFRDVAALAELLNAARDNKQDYGGPALLTAYQRQRRFDNMAMAGATDSLNRLFSNALPPLPALRRLGLGLVARTPAAKKLFMHQAMGAAGLLPDLIREAEAG